MNLGTNDFDVVVIGGGVVGAALARELSAFDVSVALADASNDVCEGTSKANTAILHTGFDASPGTLEAKLVARGYELTSNFCDAAGICYERRGAILVAWDEQQLAELPNLLTKAHKNGYKDCRIISKEEVFAKLPHAASTALGGLFVAGESIIDPWSVPLALATDAINRGAQFLPNTEVTGARVERDRTIIETTAGAITARWVVNAAGLGADKIDQLFGYSRIECHPRKGQLIVYDKLASRLIDHIVLPVPTKMGKGVLVSPTIFGNVMLGPTAEDIQDREDTSTTQDGFQFLLEKGAGLIPELLHEEVTSTYSGLRAAHNLKDYLLGVDAGQRYVIAAAIRSTGLTSAMAVAEYLVDKMQEAGFSSAIKDELPDAPKMPPLGEHATRPHDDAMLVASDPDYGRIVCFCERVSLGEIRDTFATALPPRDLEGLRRRTRAMNGRCQGFFCGAEVMELFDTKSEGR